jgi:hypothetical protein
MDGLALVQHGLSGGGVWSKAVVNCETRIVCLAANAVKRKRRKRVVTFDESDQETSTYVNNVVKTAISPHYSSPPTVTFRSDGSITYSAADGSQTTRTQESILDERFGQKPRWNKFARRPSPCQPEVCWIRTSKKRDRSKLLSIQGTVGYRSIINLMLCEFTTALQYTQFELFEGYAHTGKGSLSFLDLPADTIVGQGRTTAVNGEFEARCNLDALPQAIEPVAAADLALDSTSRYLSGLLEANRPVGIFDLPVVGDQPPLLPEPLQPVGTIDWSQISHLLPGPLGDALAAITDYGTSVAHILSSIVTESVTVAPFVMPALRLYAYYTQNFNQPHNCAHSWDRSKQYLPLPKLAPWTLEPLTALRSYANFSGLSQRTAIDPNVFAAKNALRAFNDEDSGQRAILAIATRQAVEIADSSQKIYVDISTDVSEVTTGLMARRFPEFTFRHVSKRHVHGVAQATRHIFMMLAQQDILRRDPDARVRMVGAMPGQVARFANVIHSDSPNLSGRDDFRLNVEASLADKRHFARITHDCKYEDCLVGTPGAIGVMPFSAGDIGLANLSLSMIRQGVSRTYVMINLPVPMLDRRVKTYRDDWSGLYYERKGDSLRMYFTGGASAGYVNDFEKVISFCSPPPTIPGFHVQVEELRRFGTQFLLEIRVGIGPAEKVPTMWRVTDEQFYILPILQPKWRNSEKTHFVVPRRRFEACTEFVSTLLDDDTSKKKNIYERMATKVRGQQAEVKIGAQVLEPRWDMDPVEFNSVIGHCFLAARFRKMDLDSVVPRLEWHLGAQYLRKSTSFVGRLVVYLHDLFTLSLTDKGDPLSSTNWEKFLDWIFASNLDHGQPLDYYEIAGEYRVVNETTETLGPAFLGDLEIVSRWCYSAGKKVASWSGPYDKAKAISLSLTESFLYPSYKPRYPHREVTVEDEAEGSNGVTGYIFVGDDFYREASPSPVEMVWPAVEQRRRFYVDPHGVCVISLCHVRLHYKHIPSKIKLIGFEPHPECEGVPFISRKAGKKKVTFPDYPIEPEPIKKKTPLAENLSFKTKVVKSAPIIEDLSDYTESLDSENERRVSLGLAPLDETPSKLFRVPPDEVRTPVLTELPPLRKGETPIAFYEVDGVTDEFFTEAKVVFDATLENAGLYGETTSKSNDAFWAVAPPEPIDILLTEKTCYAPDKGLLRLLEVAASMDRGQVEDPSIMQQLLRAASTTGTFFKNNPSDLLAKVEANFYKVVTAEPNRRPVVASVVLDGVASAAKSTVVCQYINTFKGRALVVTPSRKLANDWRKRPGRRYDVVTQHAVTNAYLHGHSILVLDEVFAMERNVVYGWALLAARMKARLILLGEHNQAYKASEMLTTDDLSRLAGFTIYMPVAHTLSWDVMTVLKTALSRDHLIDMAQTTCPREYTINFVDPEHCPNYDEINEDDSILKMVARVSDVPRPGLNKRRPNSVSISQAQGSRERNVVFEPSGSYSTLNWLANNPNQLYVAISRQTNRLDFLVNSSYISMLIPRYRVANRVGFRGPRQNRPFRSDNLLIDVTQDKYVDGPAMRIEDVKVTTERVVAYGSQDDAWFPEQAIRCDAYLDEVREFVAEHSQHDAIFDHDHALNLHIARKGTLSTIGNFELVTKDDPRSAIDGATKLAVHQLGANTMEDLRNVALRQTDVSRPVVSIAQAKTEARFLFRELKRQLFSDDFVTFPCYVDPDAWLDTRSSAYLHKLYEANDAYLEAGHTTSHSAFLKTQDKVKPEPGFSATLTHGQTVIASSETYNARMGPAARNAAERIKDRLLPNVIMDVGYSDRELGRIIRETGIGREMLESNVQVDITRQDSSHTSVTLCVMLLVLEYVGVEQWVIDEYAERRSYYRFRSMAPYLYSGHLCYNLPSGDPFTLLANILHQATILVERFKLDCKTAGRALLIKGDDGTASGKMFKLRTGPVIPSCRSVKLKIFTDLPPYHAGRLILEDDVAYDFVRLFLKHFARNYNPNVSNDELYMALIDRIPVVSEARRRYMVPALQRIYTDFSLGEIDMFFRVMCRCARDRAFFELTYKRASADRFKNLRYKDFPIDCARSLMQELRPNVDASVLGELLEASRRDVARLFRKHTRVAVYEHTGKYRPDVRHMRAGIHVTDSHVFLIY